jgi:septum formation protein
MFTTTKQLILASASPRRKRLLSELGLQYSSQPADIDETPISGEKPIDFAKRMATTKAQAIASIHPEAFVLAADTIVVLGEQIIGKPENTEAALATLQSLQGKTHRVITGLTLLCLGEDCKETLYESTEVCFNIFTDEILRAYIATKEPLDKAGSYGVQGKGGFLVHHIHGSCSNAIGLPMATCIQLLLKHSVIFPVNQSSTIA